MQRGGARPTTQVAAPPLCWRTSDVHAGSRTHARTRVAFDVDVQAVQRAVHDRAHLACGAVKDGAPTCKWCASKRKPLTCCAIHASSTDRLPRSAVLKSTPITTRAPWLCAVHMSCTSRHIGKRLHRRGRGNEPRHHPGAGALACGHAVAGMPTCRTHRAHSRPHNRPVGIAIADARQHAAFPHLWVHRKAKHGHGGHDGPVKLRRRTMQMVGVRAGHTRHHHATGMLT
jgi:hypothetical protein